MGFSWQECWSGLLFPSPVDHMCRTSPPWSILPGWPYMAWLIVSFRQDCDPCNQFSFLWLWFSFCLPSDGEGYEICGSSLMGGPGCGEIWVLFWSPALQCVVVSGHSQVNHLSGARIFPPSWISLLPTLPTPIGPQDELSSLRCKAASHSLPFHTWQGVCLSPDLLLPPFPFSHLCACSVRLHLCCCLVAESFLTLCEPLDCVAHQAPLSVGFPRQEYWSGLPFPSPGDLPNPGIELGFPVWPADSLPTEPCVSTPALQTGRMNFFWGNLHFSKFQLQKQLQPICTDRHLVWRIRNVQRFGRCWWSRVSNLGFQEWFPEQKYCTQPGSRSEQATASAVLV